MQLDELFDQQQEKSEINPFFAIKINLKLIDTLAVFVLTLERLSHNGALLSREMSWT